MTLDSGEIVVKSEPTGNMPPENVPAPEQGAEGGDPQNLLAGKFKSAEELEKAYVELQKKLGSGEHKAAPSSSEEADQTASETATNGEDAGSNEPVIVAGLDVTEFSKEFASSGKLSDASYSKLEAAGFPRDVVDAYIRGQMESAKGDTADSEDVATQRYDLENEQIVSKHGGYETYSKAVQWAKANMSKAEIETFNRLMDNGDKATREWAVDGLMSRYTKAYGSEPHLVRGTPTASASDVFKSTAEVVAAMKDPRYGKDPEYTREVTTKVSRSKVFGR